MAARRLTRKEIVQQDAIRKTLTETSHWAVEHVRKIVAAVVVVLVMSLSYIAWDSYSSSRSAEMQGRFAKALETYHAPVESEMPEPPPPADGKQDAPQPPSPEVKFKTPEERYQAALTAFEEVASSYPGTHIGQYSRYYAALCEMELGRKEDGKQGLSSLLGDVSEGELKNMVRYTLAQIDIEDGSPAEAANLLSEILENSSSNFPKQTVLLRLARSYEASNQPKEALERYRQLESEYSGTEAATEAQSRIRRLEAILPPDAASEQTPEGSGQVESKPQG